MPEGPAARGQGTASGDGVAARHRRTLVRGEGAQRIADYSDGVFAFAMTLLVVDVALPDSEGSAEQVLLDQLPHFLSFALSFAIVAYVWVGHHRRFRVIVRHDTGLMLWNLVLLFLIASVPFPTALLSRFAPDETVVVLYASLITAIVLVQMIGWWQLRRAGLLAASVDPGLWRFVMLDFVPNLALFALSIPVALVFGGEIAMYCWLSLFIVAPVFGALSARAIDRAEREHAAAEAAEPEPRAESR